MFSTESRRGRRVLARLGRGDDLFEQIRSLCRTHQVRCAELRGSGSLDLAELDAFDQEQRAWKPPRVVKGGGLELLHLCGSVSEEGGRTAIEARATLMRDRDTGVEVLGGHLRRAVVHSVELVLESFDDVVVRRGADPTTGLSVWREAIPLGPEPAGRPEKAPVPVGAQAEAKAHAQPHGQAQAEAPTWAEVAAASAPEPEPEPEPEEVSINPGDVLVHPRFGRTVVHRVESGGEFVQVALRNGRVVRLSLEVLRLHPQGVENGQRIFSATVV